MHRMTRRAEAERLYPWVTVMVPVGAACFHSPELMKPCAGVGRGALALVRVPGQPSKTLALKWVLTSLTTRVLYCIVGDV